MVKIKTKKTVSLPQLIEWAMENGITNKWYRAVDDTEYISEVFFNESGLPQFSSTVDKSDTFTIEIEEEITEDTMIDGLVELGSNNHYTAFFHCNSSSINEQKDSDSEAFYILNDDLTLTLIWTREKGLVE